MSVGDQNDITSRLKALMPNGWFPVGASPIRDAILTGFANMFAFIYSLLAYIRQQTRIATTTGPWLDLIAYDFFGTTFARSPGQSDTSFRNQIIALLFKKKNTRAAIEAAVYSLLGTTPVIIEPNRAADTMCWDVPQSGGYDVAGVWSDSDVMPLECFVDVLVPGALSIAPPLIGGYGSTVWGYGVGQGEYIGQPALNPIQTADIMLAIAAVLPVTGVAWVNITVGGPSSVTPPPITVDTTHITTDTTALASDGGST